MFSALDLQLSGGRSKLMCEGSQCQVIRKKLSNRQREFEFWLQGRVVIGSTERRLLQVLLWGQKQKDWSASNQEPWVVLTLAKQDSLPSSKTMY